MAITINGTGTITGVSVGGLPDGIVDTDMLASGAITAAGLPDGSIINTKVFVNSTRASLSEETSRTSLMTVSFNKTSSTSTLVFFGTIPGHSNAAGHCAAGISYGTTSITGGWHYSYVGGAYSHFCGVAGRLSGHTTTGSQDFKVEYFSDNSTGVRPFVVVNPNSTDDSRMNQQISHLVIMEVEL